MCKIICVTNRKLCREDFFKRIEKIASLHLHAIVLREKDLPEIEYEALAKQVLEICEKHCTQCILHSFPDTAIKLGHSKIHLPLHLLRELPDKKKKHFDVIGSSVHSVEDAVEAERLGCTYITAGHIFATDCKKGLEPRGLDFLKGVVQAVNIPVFGIGGIGAENLKSVTEICSGACIMSGLMVCDDPKKYMEELTK